MIFAPKRMAPNDRPIMAACKNFPGLFLEKQNPAIANKKNSVAYRI